MPVLQYDFKIIGEAAINKALAGIERRMQVHNRRVTKSVTTGMPRGTAATRTPARAGIEAQRAAREQTRAQQQVERARIRSEQRVDRVARRIRTRRRKAEIRAVRTQEKAAIAAAKREAAARQRFASATAGRIGSSAIGTAGAVGRAGASVLGISGGFLAAGAVRNQMRVESASAALANQAFREGQGPSREEIARGVQRQARQLGATSGLGAEGVVRGMRESVAISGDLGITQQLAPLLTDIADATDADIGDVGRTSGQIVQAFKARGLEADEVIRQTSDVMASMAGQAKVGSIEFRDLAQQMGKLISSTATFEGEAGELATTMGAVAQLAIAGAASSPEEAMTSILRFADDLAKNSQRFEKQGIDVFADEGKTKLRKPEEILFDVLKQTGGDLSKVGDLFGIRAKKAVAPFQTLFTEKGGGEAGIQAVKELLESVRGAKVSPEEIKGSAAFRRQQADKQFAIAVEELNAAMGKELLPTVTKLIPPLTKMVPFLSRAAEHLADFVETFARNPIAGIGKIIAAKVALDIARAAIGGTIKKSLERSILGMNSIGGSGRSPSRGGSTVVTSGGKGGKGGKHNIGGATAFGLQAGITVASLIVTAGVANFEAAEVNMEVAGKDLNKVRESTDAEEVRKEVKEQRGRVRESKEKGFLQSFAEGAAEFFLFNPLDEEGTKKKAQDFGKGTAEFFGTRSKTEIATQESFLKEMEDRLSKLEALESAAERFEKAGLSQEESSKRLAAAAKELGIKLNRGNAPSPVES